MSLGMIVLIIVVLMLVGVVPAWPHARGWGYGPSGIVGVHPAHPGRPARHGQAVKPA
jgi:hypothetical protein